MTVKYTGRASGINSVAVVFNGPGVLKWVFASLVSSASAGNRQIELLIKDKNGGNVLYKVDAGAVQATGLTRNYNFQPGVQRESGFVAAGITIPLPLVEFPANGELTVYDTANIDAAGDALAVSYGFEENP